MPDVAVLMVAGDQVPVIPLLEVAGRIGGTEPAQSGPMAVNTGVICASTVMSMEVVTAH